MERPACIVRVRCLLIVIVKASIWVQFCVASVVIYVIRLSRLTDVAE